MQNNLEGHRVLHITVSLQQTSSRVQLFFKYLTFWVWWMFADSVWSCRGPRNAALPGKPACNSFLKSLLVSLDWRNATLKSGSDTHATVVLSWITAGLKIHCKGLPTGYNWKKLKIMLLYFLFLVSISWLPLFTSKKVKGSGTLWNPEDRQNERSREKEVYPLRVTPPPLRVQIEAKSQDRAVELGMEKKIGNFKSC